MKKRFFLLTAMAAVLFSGCQQEDDFRSMSADSQDITKVIITAELESTKATRTSTVSDGTNVSILWSEDDSLSVLMNGLKSHALFTIHDIDEEGTSAHFIGQNVIISGGTSGSDAEDAANVAIYPYTADANITDKAYNAETGEHSFCMPFPHVQQYAADGSVGNRAFPMVAVSESNYHVGFGFRPVAAGVRIGLKGEEGVKIKTIMVQSSKQKISGKAAVTASYAGMPTIAIDQTEGINNIVLDCGEEGVALNPETVTQFTVALPPMSVEENELTFTIYDTEGGFMEYVYDGAFTFARNTHYNLNKIGTYVATKKNPLAHALDQAGEGDVVNFTLASDMKVTSQLSVGWESLNLDLNGFTLDLGDNALRFDGGYTFVPNVINISNGTIKSNYSYCIFSYGIPSAITLTDVTLEGKGGIQVQGLAKNLTLNNVTMNVTGNGLNETLANTQNSKVTINGGTYKVGKLFNSFEQADDITIIGGKFNKTYTHENVVWESREGEADADVYPYTAARKPYEVDAEGNATIYAAAGLKWLAEQVNGGTSFKGLTVTLAADIDLAGEEWTPIGLKGKRFMGTFDGAGKTISNLYISTANNGAQAALFGDVNAATIKNFTVDGAKVLYPANYSDDFYGAAVVSQAYHVNIEGVTVTNSTIQGNNKVAAILAHDADASTMTISNCHVDKCVIETKNEADGGNAAGIVGSIQGGSNSKSLTGCSVKNTTFNVVNSADAGKRSNAQMVATVIATNATVLTLTDCVVEGNTFNQTGVTDYVTPYDGIFVGGARTDVTGKVIVNGVAYPKSPVYIGETGYPTIQAAIDAVAENNATITVAEGTYHEILKVSGGKKFSIMPAVEGATVKVAGIDHQTNSSDKASEVTFKGLTIDNTLQAEMDGWYTGTAQNLKVCVGIWGGNLTFENCDFYVSGASKEETGVMSWWTGDNLASLTFTGCKFDGGNASARAMQIYGKVNLEVEGCTFNTKKDYSLKYVGAEGTEANFTNNTVNNTENFVELGSSVYPGKNYKVTISNSTLGEGINNYTVANPEGQTVIVDGEQVYPIVKFKIGDTPYATFAEACAAAVDGDVIVISEGEYTLPLGLSHDKSGKLTIKGAGKEKTNILGTKNANNNPALPGNYANGMELVFEDLTYTTVNEGYYGGFGHAKSVAFNKCKIVGQMYCHSNAPHTFTDCTIDPLNGYLYTYASDCVFTGCKFEASEGKALQVYAEAAGTFKTTITNCTFTAAKQAQTWDGKPVTGIDVNSANGAVMVVEITGCSQEGFPEGLNSGSALWNVKNTTADITVTVDGKKVWPEAPVFNITSSNTEALTTAVATPDATVEIAAGTYTFPKSFAKGVTVVCEEGTVFDGGSSAISLNINGATVIGAEFTSSADRVITGIVNGTIKDCTFTGDRALRYCYAGETCVFENCVFDGVVYGAHFDGGENDATFRNCTFSGFNTFGHAITLLTLENCNFKSNGKTAYNGVNLWGNTNLVGTKFYFDGEAEDEWISAASADIEVSFTNCEIVDSEKSLTDWLDESNDPGTVFTINGDTYTTK